MKKATEVKPLEGYRIWLRFSDGTEGEVDLGDLAGRGVFRIWKDRKVFEAVRVTANGALAWGEEVDLCPDSLYLRLTGQPVDELFPRLKSTPVDA